MSKPHLAKRPVSAHSIPDAAWAEAVRRDAVIRPLAGERRLGRVTVQAAARMLGLSEPRVYSLVRAFRRHPVTASLAPSKSGPAKGTRRLGPVMDAMIEAAIDAVYLREEKPTLKELFRQVGRTAEMPGSSRPL